MLKGVKMNRNLSESCYDLFFARNKSAYEEKIKEIAASGADNIRKLICTVDWKDIADNYGLRAGDEAILAVSLALEKCYLGREIYRTRHNEFAVLELYDDFEERIKEFYKAIEQWHGILAPSVSASIVIINE